MYFLVRKKLNLNTFITSNGDVMKGKITEQRIINIESAPEELYSGGAILSGIKAVFLFFLLCLVPFLSCQRNSPDYVYDVIVLGSGTGATAAAIQAARSGAITLWINPLDWPGGMLTAAGVSATDGNHQMPAGIWGEFRALIWDHYGGPDSVFTGWVSNTMFEPKVGRHYFEKLVNAESNLEVWKNSDWTSIEKNDFWKIKINGHPSIRGKILIDGTDLGDVAAQVGASYDLGMDSKAQTGESIAPEQANNIIQDLTYAAILTDFGKGTNKTIPKPKDYDPSDFQCSCLTDKCKDVAAHPCEMMLNYGQLPNQKYMINWPKYGNDFYANVVEMNPVERAKAYEKAKLKTLQFIYFIQTELGYSHLGLAEDEFPTIDKLPLYPYHREGRRIHGLTQLNLNHIQKVYAFNLYRTGIAVGDYPIDHHHAEHPDAPEIEFPAVPSFSIPVGCLIPRNVDDIIIADKAISVSNIVNGASRLQPVVLQIGQIAGIIAAKAALKNTSPKNLAIRDLQKEVIYNGGYLLPFIDVPNDDIHFEPVQKIGATGILRGEGVPYQWANQTWFYPDSFIIADEILVNLQSFDAKIDFPIPATKEKLSIKAAITLAHSWQKDINQNHPVNSESDLLNRTKSQWESDWKLHNFDADRWITRKEFAVLLDRVIDPFQLKAIDFEGNFK